MSSNGDIWAKTKRHFAFFGNSDLLQLEGMFASKFIGGVPVVFTSARAGLYLLFKNFHQNDLISVFPYASQCVVKAGILAEKAVCTSVNCESREIAYNQWGLFHKTNSQGKIFLEDSADSFYPEGGRVCKNNSRFEIWSLPKSLGVSFGGVIWCQQLNDATVLRNLRNNYPSQNVLHELIFGFMKKSVGICYSRWENYEFSHPRLNRFQIKTLTKQIINWNVKYEKRKELFIKNYISCNTVSRLGAEKTINENFGIIPTVIEIPEQQICKKSRILHKVYPDGRIHPAKVLAYLANKKA